MSTSEDKLKAAYALNLCMVSVSQIIDYDDVNVLEQERDNILNNINLEQIIKDEALLDAIKIILDQIVYIQIATGNKQIVEAEYQNRIKNAIWTAIPNMGLLVATGNPIAMAITIASQIGIGYMNYRRNRAEYQLEKEKALWEIKESEMNQLNRLQQSLFEAAWRLSDTYGFPDEYRLTIPQIHEYNLALMEQNAVKRYEKLNDMRRCFSAYPQFWYQIGSTANSIYRDDALNMTSRIREFYKKCAIECFEEYYHLNKFSILRNDIITAAWALEYIDLLNLNEPQNISKGAALADIAEKNVGPNNGDILELCAYAQLKLGDKNHAARLFKKLVAQNYNSEINARILSGLYIQQSRSADTREQALIEYEKLPLITDPKYLLPMPSLDESWNPEQEQLKPGDDSDSSQETTYEELTLSYILNIAKGETLKYQNKIIHFQSLMNCEGALEFHNCVLHYNETSNTNEIKLTSTASLSMQNCTIVNHGYDKHVFLDASEAENEIRFTNCGFSRCCRFLKFGKMLLMKQCKTVDAGEGFISYGHQFQSSKAIIAECEFLFIAKPSFFPEKSWDAVISCDAMEMSQCSVQGQLKIPSASALEEIKKSDKSQQTLWKFCSGTVTNCSFEGVENVFYVSDWRGKGVVSSSSFENCLNIIVGYNYNVIVVEDCRFEKCTEIANGLNEGSRISVCQFNNCFCELISTDYEGGTTVELCEFNNWVDTRRGNFTSNSSLFAWTMMRFKRTRKDGNISTVSRCVFNGMSAHNSFLIVGDILKNIDGYAVRVEKCDFRNCTTDRKSGKIIKEYDTYFTVFNKEKQLRVVSISDCRGLDQINKESCVNTDVVVKTKNSVGAMIGVSMASAVAGLPGYVAASLINKAASDDETHAE